MIEHTKPRVLSFWIAIISIALAATTFFLPVAHTTSNITAAHWRAAVSTLITALYLGSATSFLDGLKSFTRDLRVAYRFIALGIIAFSVVYVQVVFWGLFDMWDSAWATSGSGLVPFIFTCAFIYAGVRKFARVVGVKSIACSFWFVTAISVVVTALTYVAAANWVQYTLNGVALYIAVCAICSSYLFFAGLVAFKIFTAIGPHYKAALGWLAVSIFGLSAAAAHEAINTFWFTNGDTYTDYGYYLIPWVVAGFLLLRASYAFRLLPAEAAGADDAKGEAGEASSEDYIDSILNVVTLVARPDEVDPILDEMRRITANREPGAELSVADREKLVQTYDKIEQYLMEKDPIQTFTEGDIRARTTPAFHALINKRREEMVSQHAH